ncbi:hypothetical protein B0I75DRAFT_44284 [Yarrowia lipolytica]|nr:hypothetical protein B0I75DRAFT_44284 [Yarrowia lipolytica]
MTNMWKTDDYVWPIPSYLEGSCLLPEISHTFLLFFFFFSSFFFFLLKKKKKKKNRATTPEYPTPEHHIQVKEHPNITYRISHSIHIFPTWNCSFKHPSKPLLDLPHPPLHFENQTRIQNVRAKPSCLLYAFQRGMARLPMSYLLTTSQYYILMVAFSPRRQTDGCVGQTRTLLFESTLLEIYHTK